MSGEHRQLEDDPRAAIDRAASVLLADGVVVFPTDTVYGLFAAASSATAYRRLFELKQRPADKPLALLTTAASALARRALDLLAPFPVAQGRLRDGGLTLIIEAGLIPDSLLPAGVRRLQPGAVGVRLPAHQPTQALLNKLDGLVWATSANHSQAPPAATAAQLEPWLRSLAQPPELVVTSRLPLPGRPSMLASLAGGQLLPQRR